MTRIRDKWGLPRRWTFWRDWAFWFYLVFDLLTVLPFAVNVKNWYLVSLEFWSITLIAVFMLVHNGVRYWVLYDTWRWEMPDRLTHCLLVFWSWPFGLGLYLSRRPEWIDEIVYRQDKLI